MPNQILLTDDALDLAPGADGPIVGELQHYLSRFGWLRRPDLPAVLEGHELLPEGKPDRFDENTETALAEFQRFYRLPVTGTLNAETLALMWRPRCGVPDTGMVTVALGDGAKPPAGFVAGPNKWKDLHLGYQLLAGSSDLSNAAVRQALRFAYRTWCLIAQIEAHPVSSKPDMRVRFESGTGDHGCGTGDNAFDGVGGTLAHAHYPPPFNGDLAGDIHFDEAETWTRDDPPTGTDFDTVALHEAGHSLGLDHSGEKAAVMYAFYGGLRRTLTADDIEGMRSLYGKRGRNRWTNIDAAVDGQGRFAGKAYFFRGDRYLRYDWGDDLPDPGYSKAIAGNWPGLPASFTSGIDATLNGQAQFGGKLYFFKGDKYVRYDWSNDRADAGYPKSIAGNWPGLPAGFTSGIDAAVSGVGPFAGKAYFFKGDSYIRYDWSSDKADAGYPKKIAGLWHGLPAGFTSGIQAALNGRQDFAGKVYFFKGDNYVRYDWSDDRADSGYPQPIEFNWL